MCAVMQNSSILDMLQKKIQTRKENKNNKVKKISVDLHLIPSVLSVEVDSIFHCKSFGIVLDQCIAVNC